MKDAASQFLGTEATAAAVFVAVFTLIWLNFVLETVINVLFAPAISRIEHVVNSKVARYRADREGSAPQDRSAETPEAAQEEPHTPPTEDKT